MLVGSVQFPIETATKLRIGDRVLVVRKTHLCHWREDMDDTIGRLGVVTDVRDGIRGRAALVLVDEARSPGSVMQEGAWWFGLGSLAKVTP